MASDRVTVEVHLDPGSMTDAIRRDVAAGLGMTPKSIPPKWFYDERGSLLFDEITRLPEYYPTRTEREILLNHADEIAALTGAETLVELGSGTSEKTRIILDAMDRAATLERFVPLDVSEVMLREVAEAVAAERPELIIHAIVGDFEHHIPHAPDGGRRLFAFLGGTIGNFEPPYRHQFLVDLAGQLKTDDYFLLGTDLVKDVARLEAAYDDPKGVTAEFNRNVLMVINRELGADFEPSLFDHVAQFDRQNEWIEMRLRSSVDQVVSIDDLGIKVEFEAGEEILTEISAKFRKETLEREMSAAGLALSRWWTDGDDDFALSLWEPTEP